MINLNHMRNYFVQNKGFTLIELLIVIALLGALAVGLLATIDPFEQLKKAVIQACGIPYQNFITRISGIMRPKANFSGEPADLKDCCILGLPVR